MNEKEHYWNRTCETRRCNSLAFPKSIYCKRCKNNQQSLSNIGVYLNIDAGFRAVVKLIYGAGITVIESFELNMERYRVIRTEQKTYLVAYKTDFFNSFGKIFEKEGESGVGETINVEDLKMSLRKGVTDLIFVYKTGKIYTISLVDFMEHSHRRNTDAEGKAVRSVSIRHLKSFPETLTINNKSLGGKK